MIQYFLYLWPLLITLYVYIWVRKIQFDVTLIKTKRFHIGGLVAWYDLWLGAYKNPKNGCWYIMMPMVGITFTWYKKSKKLQSLIIKHNKLAREEADRLQKAILPKEGPESIQIQNLTVQGPEVEKKWQQEYNQIRDGFNPVPDGKCSCECHEIGVKHTTACTHCCSMRGEWYIDPISGYMPATYELIRRRYL